MNSGRKMNSPGTLRRRHLVVGFAAVLTLSMALPAIGASPDQLVSKALKTAEEANKRSKSAVKVARQAKSRAKQAELKAKQGPPGPQGLTGPSGTSHVYFDHDFVYPVSIFSGAIASVDVPAGSYAIIASVELNSIGGNAAMEEMLCDLIAEGDLQESVHEIDKDGDRGDIVDHATLHLTHTFSAPGTIEVKCSPSPEVAVGASITAFKVDKIN
jgi:hypothetical protein